MTNLGSRMKCSAVLIGVVITAVLCLMVPESSCQQCNYGCVCGPEYIACYSIANLYLVPQWNVSMERM